MITSSPGLTVASNALNRICLPPVPTIVCDGFVVEPVLALELGRDRLAQRLDAGDGRIFRLAALDGGDGGALDVVRRVEIRLADRQRDDVAPGGFQIARFLRHRDGRGGFDAQQGVGNESHDGFFLRVGKALAYCGAKLVSAPRQSRKLCFSLRPAPPPNAASMPHRAIHSVDAD